MHPLTIPTLSILLLSACQAAPESNHDFAGVFPQASQAIAHDFADILSANKAPKDVVFSITKNSVRKSIWNAGRKEAADFGHYLYADLQGRGFGVTLSDVAQAGTTPVTWIIVPMPGDNRQVVVRMFAGAEEYSRSYRLGDAGLTVQPTSPFSTGVHQ